MPRNSSGTYTLPAGNPVVPNTLIETTWANPTLADVASALTDSLDRFGRGGMLAPLRFPDGTVTAPSVAFSSETTLGMFRPTSGTLALAVAGVSRFLLTAALLTVTVPVSLAGGITVGGLLDVDQLANNSALQLISTVTPDWQMNGTTAAASFFGLSRYSNGANSPSIYIAHSRGATIGTHGVLSSGDQLGAFSFFGSDGTVFREGVRIVAETDGAPGASDMPGRLRVLVTPDGNVTPVEAFRISNDKAALFSGTASVTDTFTALANAAVTTSMTVGSTLTVGTTLNVAGATILQTTVSMGSNATPANTRVYIDRLGTAVLPSLIAGTGLTIAGSTAASSGITLQLISGNTGQCNVFFGDTDLANPGRITYSNSTDTFNLFAGGVDVFDISATGITPNVPLQFANGTAAAPSISFSSSPTSGFYRAGADIIGVSIAGAAAWRFDASARLVGGGVAATTTRVSATSVTPALQVNGTTLSPASLGGFIFDTAAASAPYLLLGRSRSAAPGGFTIVQSGDSLGRISVAGTDGTQFTEAARIQFTVDGTPGANDMPGRIEFYTTPDGASAPTLALTISQDSTATFTGAIAGVTAAFTETGSTTPVALNRLGSSVNCEISFQTTAGTIFAGHGAANTFAVGGASSLNTTSWFNVNASGANFAVNTSIAGTVDNTGTARFSGAIYGTLGVRETGVYGGAGPNTSADSFVIESSGNGGLSILTPSGSAGTIYFGDESASAQGRLTYTHGTDTLSIFAANASVLTLSGTAVTLGASEDLVLDGVGPTSTLSGGFRGVPQNSKSAAYTLVLSDAGRHIYHPSADTTARIWTIPANSSVAFPIGTAVTFINDTSGGVITIAITTDTLVLAGTGGTGSRTLAANGVATAVKVTATRWVISGTALT